MCHKCREADVEFFGSFGSFEQNSRFWVLIDELGV